MPKYLAFGCGVPFILAGLWILIDSTPDPDPTFFLNPDQDPQNF
jgi:hypothetical protein